MRLLVLGINHRTAPVEIRGQVAFPVEQLPRALGELTALQNVGEAAILSTCNRTELYCAKQGEGLEELTDWLCRFHGLEKGSLEPHLYAYWEADAVRHILRVAAPPIVTGLILGLAATLGGSILIETVFAWDGMGQLYFKTFSGQPDESIIIGLTFMFTIIYVVARLVLEVLYVFLDPRVRYQ